MSSDNKTRLRQSFIVICAIVIALLFPFACLNSLVSVKAVVGIVCIISFIALWSFHAILSRDNFDDLSDLFLSLAESLLSEAIIAFLYNQILGRSSVLLVSLSVIAAPAVAVLFIWYCFVHYDQIWTGILNILLIFPLISAYYAKELQNANWYHYAVNILRLVSIILIVSIILKRRMERQREKQEQQRQFQIQQETLQLKTQQKEEALRLEAQQREEDENRIKAHIPAIEASKKYAAFKDSFIQNLPQIVYVQVRGEGSIILSLSRTGKLFVPNYQTGQMEIDTSHGFDIRPFFGTANDERAWTIFELEALARIIDKDVQATNHFSLIESRTGYRFYSRIVPNERVIAKTPY